MEQSITHKTQLNYFTGWFRRKKRPLKALTSKQANQTHQNGELYVVVIGDPKRPYCFLEIRLKVGFVGVFFLDEEARIALNYLFRHQDSEGLFLEQIMRRTYVAHADAELKMEHYIFEKDGRVVFNEYAKPSSEIRRTYQLTSLAHNWEPIPAFGDYEHIAKLDKTPSYYIDQITPLLEETTPPI